MSELEETEYEVERILKKRYYKGVLQYKIKWMGYGQEYDTWEPDTNLDCRGIINEFELALLQVKTEKLEVPNDDGQDSSKWQSANSCQGPINPPRQLKGFDKGLEAKQIIGLIEINGRLQFLMQW